MNAHQGNLRFVGGLLALMVGVYGLEWIPSLELRAHGLVPRTWGGLTGILSMPFLHANLAHLISNLGSLVVLLALLLLFHSERVREVVIEVILLGGIFLWIFGRTANHIGASGLVYGLAAYLISAGLSQRRFLEVVAAVIVAMMYGSSLFWGLLPTDPGISWDGHLAGALAGVAIGVYGETQRPAETPGPPGM